MPGRQEPAAAGPGVSRVARLGQPGALGEAGARMEAGAEPPGSGQQPRPSARRARSCAPVARAAGRAGLRALPGGGGRRGEAAAESDAETSRHEGAMASSRNIWFISPLAFAL